MTASDRLRAAVERARGTTIALFSHGTLGGLAKTERAFGEWRDRTSELLAENEAALAEIEAIARELEDG